MKAKEYFNEFMNENQDKTTEWRLINVMRLMFLEVDKIAEMRNAKSDTAIISVFKEVEKKSHAFIRLVNETDTFKSNRIINNDAFKIYVKYRSPELARIVWGDEC